MKRELAIFNIPLTGSTAEKSQLECLEAHVRAHSSEIFALKTCQRLLLLGFAPTLRPLNGAKASAEYWDGVNAYRTLLEMICGLHSHILGENEIVHQFKTAYRQWRANCHHCELLKVLEKLFKDAKQIRRQYLLSIGRPTYAGIVRKMILHRFESGPLAIVGSGALAEGLAKIVPQRYRTHLFARNTERVEQLCSLHGLEAINWPNWDALAAFPLVVNTVGLNHTLFEDAFFERWSGQHRHKLMICLGEPSPIPPRWDQGHQVLRLSDVFLAGKTQTRATLQKVDRAKAAIADLAHERYPLYVHRFFPPGLPLESSTAKIAP